jgi:hypothetical protein
MRGKYLLSRRRAPNGATFERRMSAIINFGWLPPPLTLALGHPISVVRVVRNTSQLALHVDKATALTAGQRRPMHTVHST